MRYYYCFGEYENFVEHTGIHCQKRWLNLLKARHDKIVDFHKKAKSEMNLKLLAQIESGFLNISEIDILKQ